MLRKTLIMLATLLGLILASCSSPQAADDLPGSAAGQVSFRVAMVFPGSVNDKSWNEAGFAGLQRIESELDVETAYLQRVPSSDWEEALRSFASQGYSLIIAHGDQFSEPSKRVAPEFPQSKFVVVNGAYTASNLASVALFDEQVSFLAGVVAAKVSKTGKVGYIGGLEILPVIRNGKGFEQGARYVNPNIEVLATYLGDFNDANLGRQSTEDMAAQGVDVIYYYVDQAMTGIHQAARESQVKLIGCIFDQYRIAPDLILTSAIQDISKAIFEVAKAIKEGKFEGKAYLYGLESGAVALAPLRENVPAEVGEYVNQVQGEILSGKLVIERFEQ
ncbi:MAG: BMP family protein [Anaerolineales bacterium]|nr:BMP family protein [Anaerolineales bacterium]MDW8160972.1 BMP family protein [Anaerolineales bacterium]